jgi:branched-chain amino acid transport system permease protein
VSDLVRLTWAGFLNGLTYALVGLALVLVYKTARVLNFAQGTMASYGGFLLWWFATAHGFPFVLAVLAALAVTAAGTAAFERVAVRPLLDQGFLSVVVVTLGFQIFLANAAERWFGTQPLNVDYPLRSVRWDIGGVRITAWQLVIVATAAVVLSVVGFVVQRTELGLAMRAFAEDPGAARLMGISDATVSRATWVMSSLVGGVTGIVLGPVLFIQPEYMSSVFIIGFTAAVLGGFTSLSGAVLGGIFFGLVESFAVKYAPREISAILPLLSVFVILLVRPRGLFTRQRVVERV